MPVLLAHAIEDSTDIFGISGGGVEHPKPPPLGTPLSTTNKMQCYTIFFIIVSALHVSGSFSALHQELKNCTHSIWYVPGLLGATTSSNTKQAWHIPDAVCTFLELLMKGGETARNMHSIDSNKEYCIMSHLVGCT